MKIKHITLGAFTLFFVLNAVLDAAENYEASLKAGDAARTSKKYDEALAEYDAALNQAGNDTERGLALGKKGEIYANEQKNYKAAKEAAEQALKLENMRPVAKVTALRVLAECLMKASNEYNAAAKTLEQATQLEGVDWAQPSVALSLGDCYRLSDQFDQALTTYKRAVDIGDGETKAIAYLNMGITYQYNLRDFEKAKQSYAKALELKPALKKEIDDHLARIP